MSEQRHYYTDEKNAQIVIALLKAHRIRKVIANPGTTNIAFVGSVQNDSWFQVYSGIDERHSAYMAVGMAAESGEPVVLSCTGATASRNYLPALTEAYYRKLPILAITSMHNFDNIGQLSAQSIDRSVTPPDTVVKSIELRTVHNVGEERIAVRKVNDAILELRRYGGGPVHINLEMGGCMTFNTRDLPAFPKIDRYDCLTIDSAPRLIRDSKIALFIGSGCCPVAWQKFIKSYNVAVFADEGSGYQGFNRVPASLLCSQQGFAMNPKFSYLKPDLIIDVGEVSGDYPVMGYLRNLAPVWRISPDGEMRARFGNPQIIFEMHCELFVRHYCDGADSSDSQSEYYSRWCNADAELRGKIPELPFSNPWIAKTMSDVLPQECVLHLGILNSLRSWNLFPAPAHIKTFSNVGGFGIDGGLSTLVGASLSDSGKLFFGVFGDLSFFYDLNSLGNRFIKRNLRIMLVNNGCGTEFNMYFHPGSQFGAQTNDYIAAGGHFGNKSTNLVKHYAQDLGFRYLAASTKREFLSNIVEFTSCDGEKPIIFECFTLPQDESDAHKILNSVELYSPRTNGWRSMSDLVPRRVKNVVKAAIGK